MIEGAMLMNNRSLAMGALWAIVGMLVGCSHGPSYAPSIDHNTLGSTELAHYVAQQPMVTYGELCRVALLVADGEEAFTTFESRVEALKARGVIRSNWNHPAEWIVDRGTFAYMIQRTCGVKQGVNSFLANYTGLGCERYALKDVASAGIMRYGLTYQIPTGGEVMGAFAAGDDQMVRDGVYESRETRVTSPSDVQ
jgi:hypothetical protein